MLENEVINLKAEMEHMQLNQTMKVVMPKVDEPKNLMQEMRLLNERPLSIPNQYFAQQVASDLVHEEVG